ncbi:hypothetical protein Pla123a_21150 [Posidoniimonas polymericola]|uniref:LamG-like jellyroll fold domain-containing protein n=1 Tax=Posidoniimonas polymericola TaxID=2528002 RepID=A0A5C5YR86_9BACT|nr:LamG domain-containing protein [Posidoniimonas polymericola]TWT77454.1 hypothetical protein Pla123a_21150 [Posidoniimonas polymericola]
MRLSMARTLPLLGVCVLSLGLTQPTLGQSLVLQWAFDEESGDALDTGAVSPTANGTLGSGAVRSTDTPGGGPGGSIDLSATGSDSNVLGGDPLKVNSLEKFTLSTWIKMTGDNSLDQGGSNNVRLMSRQAGNSFFDGFTWNLNPPNDGEATTSSPDDFRMGMFIGGQNDFGFAFADADVEGQGGEWTFLAVSYDGTSAENNMKFFWGGEDTPVTQLGSTLTTSNDPGGLFNETPADFAIGYTTAAPTADVSIAGLQDDVRVYDDLLDLAALDAVRLENLPSVSVLLGDFNSDTVVDAADYTLWRDNDGADESVLNGAGDGSGTVDLGDYTAWAANYGAGQVALSSASVPEATTLSLACLTLAGVGGMRRRA